MLSGDQARRARTGGLRATGIAPLGDDWGSALRDVAVDLPGPVPEVQPEPGEEDGSAPSGLADLMTLLAGGADGDPVRILRVGPGRLLAFLTGTPPAAPATGRLRLVSGDASGRAAAVVRALGAAAAEHDGETRVMLVGRGSGGAAALEIATRTDLPGFVVDQVVTASAPAAALPALPADVRVLSLEDRSDPVALLGSLINAATANRLTVVYDAGADPGVPPLVAGGRAADRAEHPDLRAVLARWREQGYLRSA
ncbi:hypothetical protein G5V59_20250 [Nocardioides sp. W3-2-3]|nr:hypothetical protein [Nocardioides convexus]